MSDEQSVTSLRENWRRLEWESETEWPYIVRRCDYAIRDVFFEPGADEPAILIRELDELANELADIAGRYPSGREVEHLILAFDEGRDPDEPDQIKNRLRKLQELRRLVEEAKRKLEEEERRRRGGREGEAVRERAEEAEG